MSDNHKPSDEERLLKAIRTMKADLDAIYAQLRDGNYADPDTFINNWAHLMDRIKKMQPILSKPGVTDMLLSRDVRLTAELMAMTHSVSIIESFMRCLEHQSRLRGGSPR